MTDALYGSGDCPYHTVLRSADGRRFRGQLQHVTDRGMGVMLVFAINEGLMWADLRRAQLMLVWKAEYV